jgi:outer membrane immunogenic protein
MRSSLMVFAAGLIGVTATQVTLAADLGARIYPPPPPAYLPPAPIPYLWTGCYIGGNVGGAWSRIDLTDGVNFSATNSGFAGGGQIGCDYQSGAWVVGLRDMLDATSLSNTTTFATIGTADSRTRWFDTLTARGGFLVQPNLLLYVQGGAAWTNANITFFNGGVQLGEFSNDHTGWTVGAGVEWMFAPRWSVFAEYNFMGFGTQSAALASCGGTCVLDAKADVQNALAGVNYKF